MNNNDMDKILDLVNQIKSLVPSKKEFIRDLKIGILFIVSGTICLYLIFFLIPELLNR